MNKQAVRCLSKSAKKQIAIVRFPKESVRVGSEGIWIRF